MERKPKIFISKCIEQEHCRWNGAIISSDEIRQLIPFVDLYTACPEVEVGLGIPRDPIRLVAINDDIRLIQPVTGMDLTEKMENLSKEIIKDYADLDGFILKSKSPSCGMKDVKVHRGEGTKGIVKPSSGIFAEIVLSNFSEYAIEDEGRLTNMLIREYFLTRIFTMNRFKIIKSDPKMASLVKFHADHKFLFLAYNQTQMRELGKIVANHEKEKIEVVFDNYEQQLRKVFFKMPRHTNIINVWNHIQGFFKEGLNPKEKAHLLERIEAFKDDRIPASAVTEVLYSMAVRFEHNYILDQYFFNPFPKELMHIHDSGKRRL